MTANPFPSAGFQASDFPLLTTHARRPVQTRVAIEQLIEGLGAGRIRNTVFQEAKACLSEAVRQAWEARVLTPFFYAGRYEQQPRNVQDLETALNVNGIHDVLAAHKRVAKTKAVGAAVDAMRAILEEALPLAQAVVALKLCAVKGRKPRPEPAGATNPDKVIKTCACCFRPIAVVPAGTMAHHGYTRPGYGSQTASCNGIRFPPLEVSSAGLEWLIDTLEKQRASLAKAYSRRERLGVLSVMRRNPSTQGQRKTVTVERGSPEWAREFALYERQLENDIRHIDADLPPLKERLVHWQPEIPATPPPPTRRTSP